MAATARVTSSSRHRYRGPVTTSPEPSIRVLLVDDDAMVRAGLKMIVGGERDIDVAGEAADGQEALRLIEHSRPDVVLMDIRMPVLDGIEATRRAMERDEPPHVIVLTTFDADDLVVQALRVGAVGFLLKDTRPEQLVAAIRAVADGDPVLSPSVTRQLVARVTAESTAAADAGARIRLDALTPREHEVADCVADGLSNAQIARRLYMSVPTVKAHVSSVLAKLEAENRVQVAILVHEARRES